ncbi:hypothetical protein MMC28_007431 [Mycoblastus sanguinarius]|nr:hypothetical protein [Mycoblastus sanguinarius]
MLYDRRASLSGPLASRMKNLSLRAKLVIEIILSDNQQGAFTPSYTSLDEIKGEISITASCDTDFDDIYITFEGATRTYVEKIATTSPTNGRTEAFQNFLRLVQPMDGTVFPEPRILEARKTYKFPFTFVVPDRLLPQSCIHPKDDEFPEGAHLSLPPSLGDPMVASMGKSLMDDMAPDMGSISYSIRCRMTSGRGTTGKHRIMAEGSKKLRIIPAVEEQPPLDVKEGLLDDYRLRKEKSIRRGMFKGKLGSLTMQSVQPKSLRLPSVRTTSCCPVTTMATVKVRFDPAEESAQPPRLNTLQTKLKVATFFTSVPMRVLPAKSSDFHYSSVKGIYVEALNLSSRCLVNTQWEHHTSSAPTRRDSAWSTMSTGVPQPSSAYNGKSFYTATIVVPVSLPQNNKVFVPSFHSCLVSRAYALDLYLSCLTPSTTVTDPTLHLKLPIQVSSAGNPNAQPNISVEEANAIASREANYFFEPRSIAPPSPEYTEQAQLAQTEPPPSPGPAYSHREQLVDIAEQPTPQYSVRPNHAQQRFQSLSFENEEAALAPPPEYSSFGGRNRGRVATNVRSPTGLMAGRISIH